MVSPRKRGKAGENAKDNSQQLKRVIFWIKYSRCHKDGHYKATCKLQMPHATPNQSGPADSASSTQAAKVAWNQSRPVDSAPLTQATQAALVESTNTSQATPKQAPRTQPLPKKKKRLKKRPKIVLSQP